MPSHDDRAVVTDEHAHLLHWARSLPDAATVDLSCVESRALPTASGHHLVQLPHCLQDGDPAALFEVAAAAGQVLLRLDGCRRGTSDGLAAALELVEACRLGGRLSVTRDAPVGSDRGSGQAGLAPSRRQLFPWLAPGPSENPTRGLPPEPAPVGPARIVAALRTMGVEPSDTVPPHTGPTSPALELSSSGCTACDTCVRVCPTDALTLTGDDSTRALVFTPDRCVGCRQCLRLCPVQALHDDGPIPWAALMRASAPTVIEELRVRRCAKCRAVFGGDGDHCQTCALRRSAPFGSWLPPGFEV